MKIYLFPHQTKNLSLPHAGVVGKNKDRLQMVRKCLFKLKVRVVIEEPLPYIVLFEERNKGDLNNLSSLFP